jgi:hypothetical protein
MSSLLLHIVELPFGLGRGGKRGRDVACDQVTKYLP